jgi:thioredoxin-related protein
MHLIILFISLLTLGVPIAWRTDLNQAEAEAKKNHKLILLNFSGSDWCGPCIKLEKEIFENPEFQEYAKQNLVMVNADFPRQKRNRLDPKQTALNEKMADEYNKTGAFPLTLLLDENGKVMKSWEGIPAKEVEGFISLLKTAGK